MSQPRLCECGCGRPTSIIGGSAPGRGLIKGQYRRFVKGHQGSKGDAAGYHALHDYLGKHFPKAGVCDECDMTAKTQYAVIHGRKYSRKRDDYRELCASCHAAYDYDLRHKPGEKNGCAKLTEDDVREIRRRYAGGETQAALGREYGVGQTTISWIVNRKHWRHI